MDNRLAERLKKVEAAFDAEAGVRARWKKKNSYYYKKIIETYCFLIPAGARILEVGSGDGDLLAALGPSRGVRGEWASPNLGSAGAKNKLTDSHL